MKTDMCYFGTFNDESKWFEIMKCHVRNIGGKFIRHYDR